MVLAGFKKKKAEKRENGFEKEQLKKGRRGEKVGAHFVVLVFNFFTIKILSYH